MIDDGLAWQRHALARGRLLVRSYDLGAAARQSAALGRELTLDEVEGFRLDRRTTATPRKKLVFDGKHYAFS
ncbi:MAG: hypothetical protein LBG11_07495 [Bifidobacteriaceae bacterium]|jgi:hypothetical protein|nr:hypothetical protein [Bifidobacteriaceae bacterium]